VPERAPALEQAGRWSNPHVIQEQRRRSLAALRQAGRLIDEVVDRIDELQILIEQNAADQRSRRRRPGSSPGSPHARPCRAFPCCDRSVRHFGVGTRSRRARSASAGENRSKLVIAKDVDARLTGAFARQRRLDDRPVALWPSRNAGDEARIFPLHPSDRESRDRSPCAMFRAVAHGDSGSCSSTSRKRAERPSARI
jgi:hypothetical protein